MFKRVCGAYASQDSFVSFCRAQTHLGVLCAPRIANLQAQRPAHCARVAVITTRERRYGVIMSPLNHGGANIFLIKSVRLRTLISSARYLVLSIHYFGEGTAHISWCWYLQTTTRQIASRDVHNSLS